MDRWWWRRLRWRARGATMWPAFGALTLLDGVLLQRLPAWGDGLDLVPALLLAGFGNLAVVAVLAPLGGVVLRRRRRDLPRVVASDAAGTVLLGAGAAALLVAGVLHRPAVLETRVEERAQLAAVHHYVAAHGPHEYRAGLPNATTIRLEDDLYRTCVPGPDPKRWLCLFVSTDRDPPRVRRDDDRAPNEAYVGPGGFRLR